MTELPHDELSTALRAAAVGGYGQEAAVELVLAHGSWLRRPDFVGRFVQVTTARPDSSRTPPRSPYLAWVDWCGALAADLPCSSSERQVLALAAELAGVDSGQALGALVTGLDDRNIAHLLRAVAHANRGARRHAFVVVPFEPLGLSRRSSPTEGQPAVWLARSEPPEPPLEL